VTRTFVSVNAALG